MKAIIKPSILEGKIEIPPSKSITHRAVICASFARGISFIENPLTSEDIKSTVNGIRKLGIDIQEQKKGLKIIGNGGNFKHHLSIVNINCQDSATTLRFLTSLAAISTNHVILDGSKRLRERPVGILINALEKLGTNIICNKNNFAPIEIISSNLKSADLEMENNASSQFLSSLLLIAPLLPEGLKIKYQTEVSKPYLDLTVEVMNKFGVKVETEDKNFYIPKQNYEAGNFKVEGDYSSASYVFAASIIQKGKIEIVGLSKSSVQGDKYFLEILKKMGATVAQNRISTKIAANKLKGIKIDMADYPDLVPTLSVVAAFAEGLTKITGIAHLKHKESDRIKSISKNLSNFRIKNKAGDDSLEIQGGDPNGGLINTYNDHRIAMAFSIAGLAAKGTTTINNAYCVAKSYPYFYKDLLNLGAEITFQK